MAKKLVFDYQFDALAQTITLTDDVYPKRRLLMITNVTSGDIIYLFNDSAKSGTFSFDYSNFSTTIALDYDTTLMSDDDDLQIFVEWDNQTVEIDESYVDPVSKIRVSQPENLIDTDFEYGLQSTKWETLELTKNIPTFYSRNGDISFALSDITVQQGSNVVTVVTVDNHGLQRGTPILVQGTSSSLCDGGFTSLSVINDTTFTYQAKSTINFSGSIKTTNTEIFQGSIYSGTEFKIRNIAGITSDGATQSTLTVTTEYPTDFVAGTQFALTNSFAANTQYFNTDDVDIANTATETKTVTIGVVSSEASNEDTIAFSTIQPYNWQAKDNRSIYINPSEWTINNGDLYKSTGHGRYTSNIYNIYFNFYYNIPSGETEIGGLTRGTVYLGRIIDAFRIRIYPLVLDTSTSYTTSTFFGRNMYNDVNKITLTSMPSQSLYPHQFLVGYHTTRSFDNYVYSYFNLYNRSTVSGWNWPSLSHVNFVTNSDSAYDFADVDGKHFVVSSDTSDYGYDGGGVLSTSSSKGSFEALSSTSNQIFYVRQGTNYLSYPSINGSSNMTLTVSTTADLTHIPVILRNDRNSIYLANHGLTTGDVVTYSLTSGTAPSGLVNGRTYTVERVSSSRFRLLYNNSEVQLGSFGTAGSVLSFDVLAYNQTGDTIYIQNNSFQEGDEVEYNVSANGTAIGGLTSGNKYYVYRKSNDRFRLASNPSLVTGKPTIESYSLRSNIFDSSQNYILNIYGHGYTTGNAILYTQSSGNLVGKLQNGGIYYVNVISSTAFSLHYTRADALADTNRIAISIPSAQPSFKETYAIDLTSKPASNESHYFASSFVGAADGNYSLVSTSADQMSFTLSTNAQILGRKISTTVQNSFIENENAFYYRNHGFAKNADVVYTSSQTHFSGLTSGTTYYAIPLDQHRFQLASSQENASDDIPISLSSTSTSSTPINDTVVFQGNSIVAAAVGSGSISVSNGSNVVTGDGTLFNSLFKSGDTIKIATPSVEFGYYEGTSNVITTTVVGSNIGTAHGLSAGDCVSFILVSGNFPDPNFDEGRVFYVSIASTVNIRLHYTRADAVAGTNIIPISGSGYYNNIRIIPLDRGEIITKTISFVNSNNQLETTEAYEQNIASGVYFVNSQLLLRPDGFALHRPYDGGVELIPPTNPDSQMIRQTRKYFRYQSGKGIQVSFAVNFSPTTQIDAMYYNGSGDLYMKTRFPHRLSSGLIISVSGATGANASIFNGNRTVSSIVDDYTAVFDTGVTASADETFSGNAEFYVTEWTNSELKCGLFDDQNGIFFSYDGNNLSCCRRSSTKQISGTAQVTFRSGDVIGTGTKFLSQVVKGSYIVIKGQSYVVTKISSDTLLHISPSYRGASSQGVIITLTETTKIIQQNWSLDKADGTGYTGFYLDLSKIQMAYIDYSWYGAGKVRFGFKDQHGKVQYVHEFIHGNFKTEAYMRSGNIPARYEIQNTGQPSYVPALAHWGTSVIMDGRFDDDKAYVFNASGANISTTGSNALTFIGEIETRLDYAERRDGNNYALGYAVHVENADPNLLAAFEGVGISGANLQANTKLIRPKSQDAQLQSPYQPSVLSRIRNSFNNNFGQSSEAVRNLMLIDKQPTAVATPDPQTGLTTSTYTLDLDVGGSGANASQVTRKIPLISVRLAPSVDTSTVGKLGEREIINRMQLILSQVSILTTHTAEINLVLNGLLSVNDWQRVTNPSLSELIYHSGNDTITGGATLFSFRASGDTGTTRSQQLTSQLLGEVATLGNSILGGDQPYPDGPDVLTVVATLTEDPSTVSTSTPFSVSGRISWSESQA